MNFLTGLNMSKIPIANEVLWRKDEKYFDSRVNQEPEIM